jgi:uncharacterized membrane protein
MELCASWGVRLGYLFGRFQMWSTIFGWFIVLLIVIFVWRFVARLWVVRHESEEPAEPEADILARVKPRPNLNAGAVALEEPDDDEQ